MRIRAEPITCLKQLDRIARVNKGLEVRSTFTGDGELHCNVVSFARRDETEHDGLFAMFAHWKREGQSLRLELAAHRWNPDPCTYDAYVAAAHRLFQPILDIYNRKFGTRHRMRIQTREQLLPRMTPMAQKAFDHSALTANKSALHPLDWEKFYRFVTVCRRTNLVLDESEIRWFCRRAGFSPDQSSALATAYSHCSDFYSWLRKFRR